ncbi:MAG TPA: STAS domain-containing protein [Candidatus Krumholzibacteria bacterium]|nr:STAS domain-containing protein [Candidatus Krumholzibacteria bacterium]
MFDIRQGPGGEVLLSGRLDAAQVERVRDVLKDVQGPCVVDFAALDYISSAGMGVLLGAQKRLSGSGQALKLINMNKHIREIFRIAGFDKVFLIE